MKLTRLAELNLHSQQEVSFDGIVRHSLHYGGNICTSKHNSQFCEFTHYRAEKDLRQSRGGWIMRAGARGHKFGVCEERKVGFNF